MIEFIDRILTILKDNGFPQKRVSLPTEKLYESADKKGLSLNKVFDQMKENTSISIEIGDEKIVFSQEITEPSAQAFEGMGQADMMKKAQEMLSKMDPEELKKMQEMFTNMSDEEKEQLMQKGKDLGIV